MHPFIRSSPKLLISDAFTNIRQEEIQDSVSCLWTLDTQGGGAGDRTSEQKSGGRQPAECVSVSSPALFSSDAVPLEESSEECSESSGCSLLLRGGFLSDQVINHEKKENKTPSCSVSYLFFLIHTVFSYEIHLSVFVYSVLSAHVQVENTNHR